MDQLQIDLSLAAAGDAGQQEGLKTTKAGADRFERRALLRIQRQLGLQQLPLCCRGGLQRRDSTRTRPFPAADRGCPCSAAVC